MQQQRIRQGPVEVRLLPVEVTNNGQPGQSFIFETLPGWVGDSFGIRVGVLHGFPRHAPIKIWDRVLGDTCFTSVGAASLGADEISTRPALSDFLAAR